MTERRVRDIIADAKDAADWHDEAHDYFQNTFLEGDGVKAQRVGKYIFLGMRGESSIVSHAFTAKDAEALAVALLGLAAQIDDWEGGDDD